ncbi:hypothetical protein [Roseiconus lacunae]|uniref:Uncharacterized protein n=1 Tax=Roseiconus lacunae TaxID=2605694 RepID=A0ABT7PRT6_9BACT|nr:hypothetical protein [Roseiconus lacunae]MCD0463228.1 hypothetical protein [Roseiconus lacunae]MDM4019058.1 hypothetical protein [Roseiconus lacunae]
MKHFFFNKRWEHAVTSFRLLAVSSCLALVAMMMASTSDVLAADPLPINNGHPLYHRMLPPGAIWASPHATQMQQSTFQPVAFSGPEGTKFSLPLGAGFAEEESELMAGLMVGAVYRFRITNIPQSVGVELYPTVELIGKLNPPPGKETLFPIPINLSESDLLNALDGNLVTRVIYLEDPQTAVPLAKERQDDRPIDIPLDQDALATADSLGRPIAIVRLGSKSPPRVAELQQAFYFGYPSWAPIYQDTSVQETVLAP